MNNTKNVGQDQNGDNNVNSMEKSKAIVLQKNGCSTAGKNGAGKMLITSLLIFLLLFALAACGTTPANENPSTTALAADSPAATIKTTPEATPETTPEATAEATPEAVAVPATDRAGNPIAVPAEVKRIVSLAPSFTETLIDLGLSDRIVAIDKQATALAGVNPAWPVFDLMTPDAEKILQLKPDVIIATGMSMVDNEDPFKPISDTGVCVIYIPSSDSIKGIQEDLMFIGAVTGTTDNAQKLVDKMQAGIDSVAAIGKTVSEKKKVYFEIGAAPYMYSFGSGVFLNEMIELIGAENVFANEKSWLSVSEESALAANPDVILTNVNYIPEPVAEIKARAGWDVMKAVKDGQVFYIDNMASSLPDHNIVKALNEMAKAVYPDIYK